MLSPTGSFYLHLDYREVHYAKVLCDAGLRARGLRQRDRVGLRLRRAARGAAGRPSTTTSSSTRRTRTRYFFDADAVDRIPYMAPGLVGPEKAARGKLPTDTWWHTIVSPTGKEKLGYPTQKPLGILRRIVGASCPPGGSCSTSSRAAARRAPRRASSGGASCSSTASAEAVAVMRRRFAGRGRTWRYSDARRRRRSRPRGRRARSRASSRPTERRISPSPMPRARRASGREARVRHDGGVLGERLDAAEALGAGEDAERLEERARLPRARPSSSKLIIPPGPLHLPLGERVARVRREARVADARDPRVLRRASSASARALSTWRCIRTPSVLSPRRTR